MKRTFVIGMGLLFFLVASIWHFIIAPQERQLQSVNATSTAVAIKLQHLQLMAPFNKFEREDWNQDTMAFTLKPVSGSYVDLLVTKDSNGNFIVTQEHLNCEDCRLPSENGVYFLTNPSNGEKGVVFANNPTGPGFTLAYNSDFWTLTSNWVPTGTAR